MSCCPDCNMEMLHVPRCTFQFIKINGAWYDRNTNYYDVNRRCHSCNVVNKAGTVHHFGCDVERCPVCAGQLISCSCKKEGIGKEM